MTKPIWFKHGSKGLHVDISDYRANTAYYDLAGGGQFRSDKEISIFDQPGFDTRQPRVVKEEALFNSFLVDNNDKILYHIVWRMSIHRQDNDPDKGWVSNARPEYEIVSSGPGPGPIAEMASNAPLVFGYREANKRQTDVIDTSKITVPNPFSEAVRKGWKK